MIFVEGVGCVIVACVGVREIEFEFIFTFAFASVLNCETFGVFVDSRSAALSRTFEYDFSRIFEKQSFTRSRGDLSACFEICMLLSVKKFACGLSFLRRKYI